MHPYALTALFGIGLALWVLLLMVEAKRGTRVLSGVRGSLDRAVLYVTAHTVAHLPRLDRYYFRQLFHYLVHVMLSALLWCTTRIEKQIKRIVRLNRSRARIAREPKIDSHLSQVLAHKEEVALSSEEKEVRRDAALRGDTEGQ
jgi:hypothetical protein